MKDLTGLEFGKFKVISKTDERRNGHIVWECLCECGTVFRASGKTIRNGGTTSCGCARIKHGESTTRLYDIWIHIKDRTMNPDSWSAENYYDRGITLCEEWLDYPTFSTWAKANGYTEDTTIDRIDVNGNYEPSNCRWTTPLQQANNRRTCIMIEFNGKTQSLADWAREIGVSYDTIRSRYRREWTVERMLTTKQQIKRGKGE